MQFEDAFHEAGSFGRAQKWAVFTCILIHAYSGWPFIFPFLIVQDVSFQCLQEPFPQSIISPGESTENNSLEATEPTITPNSSNSHVERIIRQSTSGDVTQNSTVVTSFQNEENISGSLNLTKLVVKKSSLLNSTADTDVNNGETSQCPSSCTERLYADNSLSSPISSFDLGCNDIKHLRIFLSRYAFLFGFVLSCLTTSQIGDFLGRKSLLVSCQLISLAFSFILPYAPTIDLFALNLVILGFLHFGVMSQSFVLLVESCTSKHVSRIGTSLLVSSSFGIITAGVCASFITSWKTHALIMSSPQVFLLFLSALKLRESAQWLYYTGKPKDAEVTLRKVATSNGKTAGRISLTKNIRELATLYREGLSEGLLSDDEDEPMMGSDPKQSGSRNACCLQLFGSVRAALMLVANITSWISAYYLCYFFLTLCQDCIEDTFKLLVTISLIRLSTWFSSIFMDIAGRKNTHLAFLFSGLLIMLLINYLIIPAELPELVKLSVTIFGLILTFVCHNSLLIRSCEQLPTQLRSSGLGIVIGFGQTAVWITPVLSQFDYQLSGNWRMISIVGIVVFSITLEILFERETARKSMPQTVKQYYQLARGKPQAKA